MLINFSICQDKNSNQLDPVIKSLIIPGWGQKSLSFSKRARYYNYVESGLILTILGTTTYSNILKKNYISFASNHAALSSSGKIISIGLILGITIQLMITIMNI